MSDQVPPDRSDGFPQCLDCLPSGHGSEEEKANDDHWPDGKKGERQDKPDAFRDLLHLHHSDPAPVLHGLFQNFLSPQSEGVSLHEKCSGIANGSWKHPEKSQPRGELLVVLSEWQKV